MAPESFQFYTCCNQLVEACNTCHIVWTKMEHFLVESMCSFVEHCVIRHISTRQHVLARRGLCWSPGDLKTFGGRGDWLKLELDSTNRGIFLLHLLTIYSNTTCYIMPSEICPRTTSNMPCAVCLIGFATHPHAARYISHRSGVLGDSWFAHVLFDCIFLSVVFLQNGFGWGPLAMASYPVSTSDTELDSRISSLDRLRNLAFTKLTCVHVRVRVPKIESV